MTIKELLEEIKRFPPDAHVIVNGEHIIGVISKSGRTQVGYMNARFNITSKGNETGMFFLHHAELSTGGIVVSII